ncbi:putative quinone oxidoreductase YhfP [Ylistrum balloti]|uniref:putative quinone oxidoreductase YhfP n=1 Tax=Ylistrum balloti TaxID=509963 RepID=UPI002905D55B|nr:putative quinone oxidoreductase YhfP [Ylistrum balloti]
MKTYKAFQVIEKEAKQFERKVVEMEKPKIESGQVLIKVHFSSINYKDFLSSIGNKGVTRNYPHVPGIDASGVVEESQSADFPPGTEVIVTGFDLGMNTDGGFGEYILTPQEWVVKKPDGLSLEEAMIYGTAGFTAAQCIEAILGNTDHEQLMSKEVVVTGASGGVGSLAVMILSHLGYSVHALSRKEGDFLKQCGAQAVASPSDWQAGLDEKKPLLQEQWSAGVDTVGGSILSDVLRTSGYRSTIACCGMVADIKLTSSVFPFILRGVKLYGIDSAMCPINLKKQIWDRLATNWKPQKLHDLKKVIGLDELEASLMLMKEGKSQGRIVLRHNI